ncbi:MAG TPA: DUF1080 domain-containing protein, partial [Chryseolinea sp.]|nr:DUF1080 domain-containing protein [Chryseolinea sp.]
MLSKTLLFCLILLQINVFAQNEFYTLTPLPLNDLSAFKAPTKNWKIKANISGGFNETKSKSESGTGVLNNEFEDSFRFKPESNLVTNLEHGDIFLALDFNMPKGSNSGIYLQGRYEIQLFDSWAVKVPRVTDCGSIYERWDESRPEGKKGFEGHPSRTNASFAPNLWQHLEIEFRAPRFDANGKKIEPAQFVKVVLNGIVIHEHVILSGPTRASAFNDEKAMGPIVIQGDHGPVAFRNIQYALLDEFKVSFDELTYEYYEGDFNELPKVEPRHLVRKGTAEAIDVKLADNPNKMCLVFNGKINLKESTDYQFIVKKIGKARLSVDGQEIIRTRELFDDYVISRKLTTGVHTIEFAYLKDFAWAPTGVGLYIGKLNSRPQAMHTPASLPPLPPTPLIDVAPTAGPELVRSFMMHEGKKKTHVISVGDPAGVHYSYDLNQGALLRVWRGQFLNVTEMWYERGEPQISTSMGAAVIFKGKAPLGIVADEKTPLPDTLNDRSDLLYKGYSLDASGYPTFSYLFKNITMKDSFVPFDGTRGIKHTVSISNAP